MNYAMVAKCSVDCNYGQNTQKHQLEVTRSRFVKSIESLPFLFINSTGTKHASIHIQKNFREELDIHYNM